MVKITDLKKVKTYEDLENLGIGRVYCDISYRGGGIGFYDEDVARHFDIANEYLPGKFGAYCNYLGGGLRGCICESGFGKELWNSGTRKKARLLEELGKACVRVYEYCENEGEIEDDPINTGIGRVNQKSAY
jgi:hypothetical protein